MSASSASDAAIFCQYFIGFLPATSGAACGLCRFAAQFMTSLQRQDPLDQILDLFRILGFGNLVIFFVAVFELHLAAAAQVTD